jgi:hypothetical protein
MSILFGYHYFDTITEDLDTLKRRLATAEKIQQGNTAEIVAHNNDIKKLNSLGKNSVQYDFTPSLGYPPGFLQTPTISSGDRKNAEFIWFSISDGRNIATHSPLYELNDGSAGTTFLWTRDQSSRIIQVSFSFAVASDIVRILGMESKDIDSAGNVTNRTGTTTINCSLLTT